MSEPTPLEIVRDELSAVRKENINAHSEILAKVNDLFKCLSDQAVRVALLERTTEQLVDGQRIMEDSLSKIELTHAEERGRNQKVAAGIGSIVAAVAVGVIELIKRVINGG